MLGSAPDAFYLREPVTQSDERFCRLGTVFSLDHREQSVPYGRLADKAFLGWPDFAEKVLPLPERWGLKGRRGARVVIKEVNPLAGRWYLDRYSPRLIFLVRHPAAVALSFQKQGWLEDSPGEWARNGDFQGKSLRQASHEIGDYPHQMTAMYEDLCERPREGFRELFDFAGLTWDEPVEELVDRYSRESLKVSRSWREQVDPEALEGLKSAYLSFGLPWYRDPSEW